MLEEQSDIAFKRKRRASYTAENSLHGTNTPKEVFGVSQKFLQLRA